MRVVKEEEDKDPSVSVTVVVVQKMPLSEERVSWEHDAGGVKVVVNAPR